MVEGYLRRFVTSRFLITWFGAMLRHHLPEPEHRHETAEHSRETIRVLKTCTTSTVHRMMLGLA
jgi:hypothetical protein